MSDSKELIFDFNSNSLEIIEGNSVLNMITPNGKSPFVIRSETPDVDIHPSVEYIGKYDCQFIGNKSELQELLRNGDRVNIITSKNQHQSMRFFRRLTIFRANRTKYLKLLILRRSNL